MKNKIKNQAEKSLTMIHQKLRKKFKASLKINAENKTKRGKIESDYIKKERLSKDVRYQEFNEITLG